MLEERPLLTKALTGIVGCALGDLLAQVGMECEYRGGGVDWCFWPGWVWIQGRGGPTLFPSGG